MAKSIKKSVSIDLPEVSPKKNVVRFDRDKDDPAPQNVYVDNAIVKELGGAKKGVRIIIEAL
jgi:hypothetical protein